MKNKIKLKKYLIISLVMIVVLYIPFAMLAKKKYQEYSSNYNLVLNKLISVVNDDGSGVEISELLAILNSKEISETENILKNYGIDVDTSSAIVENNEAFKEFMLLAGGGYLLTAFLLVGIFLLYNYFKDKEINSITRCIEDINRRIYTLDIDDNSEDELSILKNEIYKTTVMLKENAENEKKSRLVLKDSLSDISHQLKTPLTSVTIMLDNLLSNPEMDADVRLDFLRTIKREIVNINFFVLELLKLSKLDTDTVVFYDEENNVADIVRSAIQNVSILSELKEVDIRLREYSPVRLLCDRKWQVEALSNILKNCIEHSSSGAAVDIEIFDKKIYALILIKDRGEGISREDIGHIFDRFYKTKNAKEDSIGIGLALAKSIIEKDDGRIEVESDQKGSTFIIKYFKTC